jgi:hypothetical protein
MTESTPGHHGAPPSREPEHALDRALAWADARSQHLYAAAFALAAVFTIAPIWSGMVLPFQDWAGNMSYVAILDGASEGSLYDLTYRTGGLLLPNGLLFWSWVGLGKALGLIVAGKVLLTVYCVALPVSVDRLLAATGRDRRFALLAFPLVYNYSMMMGFGSYTTTLPVMIYCVARAFRFQAQPTRAHGLAVAGLASLTFFGHAQVYLVLGVIAMAFVVMVPRNWREFGAHCAAFGASLLVFVPWFYGEFLAPAEETALGGRDLMPVFEQPGQMLAKWGEHTISRWQGVFDDWVFLGMLAVMSVGLMVRRVDRQPGEGRARYAIEAITFILLLTYIAIPEHTLVQAAIGSRLVVIVMLFGIGWLHMPDDPRLRGGLVVVMTALCVIFGANASSAVRAYNDGEIGENFLPMVDALPDGSRLAVITAERESRAVTVLAHQHIYGYHFALNHGLAFSGFHNFHGRHAQWRPGKHMPYPGRDPRAFLRGKNACVFDYLLVRTTNIPRWQHLAPRLTYLDHSARYSLWKIHHDRIPACRAPKKPKPRGTDSKGGIAKGKTDKPSMADTLRPSVGPTRGRTLEGDWAPPPAERPQPPGASKKAAGPTTTAKPLFAPQVLVPASKASSRFKAQDLQKLRERAEASGLAPPGTAPGDPPRRGSAPASTRSAPEGALPSSLRPGLRRPPARVPTPKRGRPEGRAPRDTTTGAP